jgi:hypothetical protein
VGAALRSGRSEMAERALELLEERLEADKWPEYYDGKRGGLIGRRANFYQIWSATGYILAREIQDNRASRDLFDHCTRVDLDAIHCPDAL